MPFIMQLVRMLVGMGGWSAASRLLGPTIGKVAGSLGSKAAASGIGGGIDAILGSAAKSLPGWAGKLMPTVAGTVRGLGSLGSIATGLGGFEIAAGGFDKVLEGLGVGDHPSEQNPSDWVQHTGPLPDREREQQGLQQYTDMRQMEKVLHDLMTTQNQQRIY